LLLDENREADVAVEYMRATVAAVDGNMRKAARLLDISPSTLYLKLKD
jgi:transcriptional regulator of acetoin/glycerol metabolism